MSQVLPWLCLRVSQNSTPKSLLNKDKPFRFRWAAAMCGLRAARLPGEQLPIFFKWRYQKRANATSLEWPAMPGHPRASKIKITVPLLEAGWAFSWGRDDLHAQTTLVLSKHDMTIYVGNSLKQQLYHQMLRRVQADLHPPLSDGDGPEAMDASAASVVVVSAYWHAGVTNLQTTCCWIMDGALGSKIHIVVEVQGLQPRSMLDVTKSDRHTHK